MLHGAPEELGEHHAHDKQLEKRRKNAPRHAQHGAFVFFLEVPLDELFEEELMASYFYIYIIHTFLVSAIIRNFMCENFLAKKR